MLDFSFLTTSGRTCKTISEMNLQTKFLRLYEYQEEQLAVKQKGY